MLLKMKCLEILSDAISNDKIRQIFTTFAKK